MRLHSFQTETDLRFAMAKLIPHMRGTRNATPAGSEEGQLFSQATLAGNHGS